MSTQRSPYQSGSGLGINSILAYINANPNSIFTSLTNIKWPKTATIRYNSVPLNGLARLSQSITVKDDKSKLFNALGPLLTFVIPYTGTYSVFIVTTAPSNTQEVVHPVVNGVIATYADNTSITFLREKVYHNGSTLSLNLQKGDTLDFTCLSTHALDYLDVQLTFVHT